MRRFVPLIIWSCLTAAETPPPVFTLNGPQADPAAVAPLTDAAVPWAAGDRILIVGDLLVAPGQPELAVRLHEALSPRGVTVRSMQNHAITIDQWRTAALAEIIAHPPRIVVLMAGVGDIQVATAAKTPPVTADVWRKAVTEITAAAQAAGAVMIICTPGIIGDKPNGGTGSTELDAYATAARAVATEAKAELCDLRAALLAVLTERNAKGTREIGVLSKTPGLLKIEGMDLITATVAKSLVAAAPRIPWSVQLADTIFTGSAQVEIKTPRVTADKVTITYTTDGSVPTDKSKLYTKPFTVSSSTQIEVLVVGRDGAKHSAEAWYMTAAKRAADAPPADTLPGLWVDHVTFKRWRNPMPPIDTLKPDFDTWWPNCEIDAITQIPIHHWPNTYFGLRFTGYFLAPLDGTYVFSTYSDDATRIFIGDTPVVKNDELHAVRWDKGAIELTKGYHPFTLLYAQGPGGYALETYVALPGQRQQRIPDMLFRRPAVKPPRKGISVEAADDTPDPKEPAKP